MMHFELNEPRAAERFWEGMREIAAAATRHQDYELYAAIVTVGRAALSQGIELVPSGGLFLRCPVCSAVPGQRCINLPGHLLGDSQLHSERAVLAERVIRGEVPLPVPL
ncbi:zinc finger domain-containing protein [Micromonospora robiginosa]|uniref:DNA-binding phage zinc finger domain-containing protein n=1 Tax=Micromonospora robiginosa TaxID=2749844 RepID=A0A7L6B9F3_9ACTN|nr:hypothetical protein [Micromonospora ferruginea]QLQ38582.1 hypothetical protein H1D33_06985 [Micromonospora ferruginea]